MLTLVIVVALAILLLLIKFVLTWMKFSKNKELADQEWQAFVPEKMTSLGTVKKLTVLPLIDWYTANESLRGEAGVSWLIRTEEQQVLMDVGLNWRKEDPSPLLRNADALGVDLQTIHHLVVSHLHVDHIGGLAAQKGRTVNLSAHEMDMSHMTIYAPTPMNHKSARIKQIDKPEVLLPGIATEGPIARSLFGMPLTQEQALGVNVEGKGLVLIVGCGHQGVRRIFERAESVFDVPVYGLIAGLHYPVTQSRLKLLGLPLQKFIGTGNPPWRNVSREDVRESIAYLKTKNLKLISISAHDSCDWTLDAFRHAFDGVFRDLKVGVPVEI